LLGGAKDGAEISGGAQMLDDQPAQAVMGIGALDERQCCLEIAPMPDALSQMENPAELFG